MLQDAKGNRLFRKVEIKIVFPSGPDGHAIFPVKRLTQRAEPKKGFGPDGIDDLLMQTADQLDTLYPWWQFRFVELAPVGRTASYVFTVVGYRTAAFPEAKPEDFTQELTKKESSILKETIVVLPRQQGKTAALEALQEKP